MVFVYVNQKTEKVVYTFDFIFKLRGIDYTLITDEIEFLNLDGEKLNYSPKDLNCKSILPATLLFEKTIAQQKIIKTVFENDECLAFDDNTDPVASIFYIISRYEEYICDKKDEHNRFPFSQSILSKYNWIEKAMCDRWANCIIKFIDLDLITNNESVSIIPTFDIDNTYAYKLKTGRRKQLSVAKDILKLDTKRLTERKEVSKGGKDPYDTFSKITSIAQSFPMTKIFWLVGTLAEKDRNISVSNLDHQELIVKMDESSEVNLHPSYASNSDLDKIKIEKENLEKVLNRLVVNSRQHFLRFSFPKTFQSLEQSGFTDEYSLGFAERAGFRCGTARPHQWFDLSKNRSSNLTIHPFVYMDGTLNEYMKLSVEKSKSKIKKIYDEVYRFGGDFIFLWHNETIGDYGKWKGWGSVLDFTLNLNK